MPSNNPDACGTPKMYEIPVKDASCGVPTAGKYDNQMKKCCGDDVPVISYNNDCASYCLAVDQTVQDLTDCLFDAGVKWKDVFCTGEEDASATGKPANAKDDAAPTKTKDETKTAESSGTGTETAGSENSVASTSSSGGAASAFSQGWPVSKGSLSIFVFLLSATVAGAAM